MEIIEQETLNKFLSKNNKLINKPMNHQWYDYYTDGRVLIRIPESGAISLAWTLSDQAIKWFSLPNKGKLALITPVDILMTDCTTCNSTGKYTTCPECEGAGFLDFSTAYSCYEVSCDTCGGIGTVSGDKYPNQQDCEWCDQGKVVVESSENCRELFSRTFHPNAMRLLYMLPNLKMYDTPINGDMFKFIFDGGEGFFLSQKQEQE
jgi:hypothetical protein